MHNVPTSATNINYRKKTFTKELAYTYTGLAKQLQIDPQAAKYSRES